MVRDIILGNIYYHNWTGAAHRVYNQLMYSETIKNIYQLKNESLSQKEISVKLNLSVGYINNVICSEKYKEYCNFVEEESELRQSSSPNERARLLVESLLSSLEDSMDKCETDSERLKLIPAVKDLVNIVGGIAVDESSGINVVEVPPMMGKDEFNRSVEDKKVPPSVVASKLKPMSVPDLTDVSEPMVQKVCTGSSSGIAPNTQNPMDVTAEPEGNETPTPTHISQNDDPWSDIFEGELEPQNRQFSPYEE